MTQLQPETLTFPIPRSAACPFTPPPEYEGLRDHTPVTRAQLWDGSHVWLITGYDDVRAVLRDPRVSSDGMHPNFPTVTPAARALRKSVVEQRGTSGPGQGFIRTDAPVHTALRRTVTREFMVKKMEALRPAIQHLVDEHIDRILAGPRPVDLVKALALPVPSTVICWLLGVPEEDQRSFNGWTRTLISLDASGEEKSAALNALDGYLDRLVTVKERTPGDDIISHLVEQQRAGRLDRDQLLATTRLLLIAGHETTANMISLGTLALLQHPEQAAALRENPDLAPGAVEELLRYLSIAEYVTVRVAAEDLEIGGQLIRAGEALVALTASANHDPDVFPDPAELQIRRDAGHHVTFGFGPHQCLGQPLARIELQVVYATLLRRIPGLRPAVPLEEIPFKNGEPLYGLLSLPVTWS